MNKSNLVVLGVMLAMVLIVGFVVFNSYVFDKEAEVKIIEPYRTTLSGEQVCLPPKDKSGAVTLECALGLKTDAGKYYALDYNLMSQAMPEVQNGQRFTAAGLVTPIGNLSADLWQRYEVAGIFSVTDGVVVEPPPLIIIKEESVPPAPEPVVATTSATTSEPIATKCYVGGCSSQLCTSEPDIVSDCMYREEYACYQEATCEVQASGECGWTENDELLLCLSSFETAQ